MKAFLVPVAAGLFAASTVISGCASITASGVTTIIDDAQQIAEETCAVVPNALSILALFNTGAYATASAIAAAICAAVGAAPTAAKFHRAAGFPKAIWTPRPVLVNGVTVTFL